MNEQIQKKMVEWIDALKSTASDQLPGIANQWVKYEIVSSSFCLLVGLGLLAAGVFSIRYAWKHNGESDPNECYGCRDLFPMFLCGGIAGVVGLIVLLVAADSLLAASLAPKVFVLNKLVGLVK